MTRHSIDRGINMIGNILNTASLHFLHIETRQTFERVVNQMLVIKYKLKEKHQLKLDHLTEDEWEM